MSNQESCVATVSIADQWKAFREWAVKPDFMNMPETPAHPDFSRPFDAPPAPADIREAYFKAQNESLEEARASGKPYLTSVSEAADLLTENRATCLVRHLTRGYGVFVN